jgi:hypothetical protein
MKFPQSVFLLTDSLSQTSATTRKLSVSQSSALNSRISIHSNAVAYLTEYRQSDCGFSNLERPHIFMGVRRGNIVLLSLRFLDVVKFTTLTPLSLLISCKLSFPIVGL